MEHNKLMNDIELITFAELIDKLITINIKLYNIMESLADLDNKPNKTQNDLEKLAAVTNDHLKLVKQRSGVKTAIDMKLNSAIIRGETQVIQEVKKYGK